MITFQINQIILGEVGPFQIYFSANTDTPNDQLQILKTKDDLQGNLETFPPEPINPNPGSDGNFEGMITIPRKGGDADFTLQIKSILNALTSIITTLQRRMTEPEGGNATLIQEQ